jgi:hypothetical protein
MKKNVEGVGPEGRIRMAALKKTKFLRVFSLTTCIISVHKPKMYLHVCVEQQQYYSLVA